MISNITMSLPKEWEIDILLNTDKNIQFQYRGNIISLNIPEPKSRTNLLYQGWVLFKRLYSLYKLKRKKCYKACISLLDSANIANIITGKKNCKVIITAIINMSRSADISVYKYVVFPLIKIFYNHATKIVAQNCAIKNDLIEHFGIKEELFTVIHNGIDISSIEKISSIELLKDEKEWFSREYTIISAGRLTYAKGQWHLIRSFSRVVQKIPNARLVIFGQGELKDYLQSLVLGYHLEDRVCIREFNKELDKYIKNSAIFAFPSMIEGMPTVLLEAMACETACIITDFKSGSREIMGYSMQANIETAIDARCVIITPVCSGIRKYTDEPLERNEEILAQVLINILQDSEHRKQLAKEGKERSKFFDMKEIIKEWIMILEE